MIIADVIFVVTTLEFSFTEVKLFFILKFYLIFYLIKLYTIFENIFLISTYKIYITYYVIVLNTSNVIMYSYILFNLK